MSLSLKNKLILSTLSLMLLPMLLISIIFFNSFSSFKKKISNQSDSALTASATEILNKQTKDFNTAATSFLQSLDRDLLKLSSSYNLKGYINAVEGNNTQLMNYLKQRLEAMMDGFFDAMEMQDLLINNKLKKDLKKAEEILDSLGGITFSGNKIDWDCINQYTGDKTILSLPEIKIGNQSIAYNNSFNIPSPLVDQVTGITNSTCTVFLRMNEEGDMLRAATTVKKNGKRAVGTYIPAINPDGNANPVIKKILNQETFNGRAYVVDNWYMTVYKPLIDDKNRVFGILYVGVLQDGLQEIQDLILSKKIGKSGYPFVINKKGLIKLHPKKSLYDKDIIKDLKLNAFQDLLNGRSDMATYEFNERKKLVLYKNFKKWDWGICISCYWDEIYGELIEDQRLFIEEEMRNNYKVGNLQSNDKTYRLFNQIRFIDDKGMEIIKVVSGEVNKDYKNKKNTSWFKATASLQDGEFFYDKVALSENTNKPELRISSPVYVSGKFKGIVVLNVDWKIISSFCESSNCRGSSYSMLTDNKGVINAHKIFSLADNINISDKKEFGNLSELTGKKAFAGEKGADTILINEEKFLVSFAPLKIAQNDYIIFSMCSYDLVMEDMIKQQQLANKHSSSVFKLVISIFLILAIIGAFVSFYISSSIDNPLKILTGQLQSSGSQTGMSAEQIDLSSQEMARSASDQAASLQEISSSMEEMASMTQQNADNSKQVARMTKEYDKIAKKGSAAMTSVEEAMNKILKSSEETAKIIKTIDEIAFQTNLLALNAAVEAARAGEAGKGFAVVAEEVRNLAMRSAEAAGNTSEIIEGATKNSQIGVDKTKDMAEILHQVIEGISKIDAISLEVASASEEQAKGIGQVNTGINQLDQATQSNAASAEETAAASKDLSSQAAILQNVVNNLQTIIYGEQNHNTLKTDSYKQPQQQRKNMDSNQPKKIVPKTSRSQLSTQQQTVKNPEEIIPLDEDDLNSF